MATISQAVTPTPRTGWLTGRRLRKLQEAGLGYLFLLPAFGVLIAGLFSSTEGHSVFRPYVILRARRARRISSVISDPGWRTLRNREEPLSTTQAHAF